MELIKCVFGPHETAHSIALISSAACDKHGGRVCDAICLCFVSAAAKPEPDGEWPGGRRPIIFSPAPVGLPHAGQSCLNLCRGERSPVLFQSERFLSELENTCSSCCLCRQSVSKSQVLNENIWQTNVVTQYNHQAAV